MSRSRTPGTVGSRAVLLVGVLAACVEDEPGEPPSLAFEQASEYFEVHSDVERCAGDLARWDGFAEFAAELLAVDPPTAQPMYVWENAAFDGVETCGFVTGGCYRESEGIIYASLPTVEHEIVHVLIQDHESPDAFFKEGLAEALSGPTSFGRFAPSFPRSGSSQVDYASAGHFVRWLIETRGLDLVLDQLDGDGSVAAFEQLTGQPLDSLVEAYFAEAPSHYAALYRQPRPALEPLDDGLWSTDLELSCAREDVHATTEGLEAVRGWELMTAGHYSIWTDTPARVRMTLVHRLDPSDEPDFELGHSITLQGEALATISLPAGAYEIAVLPPANVSETRLMVWANAAAVPVPPGASP